MTMPSDPKSAAAGELRSIPAHRPLEQDGRDMSGENLFGMRVAGWREQNPHGPEFGYVTSYHWSTPGRVAKDVTRLFTEHEVRRRFAAALATSADPAASQGEAGE